MLSPNIVDVEFEEVVLCSGSVVLGFGCPFAWLVRD